LIVKKSIKKLVLNRETLRSLDESGLPAWGGLQPQISGQRCPTVDTRQISICLSCTSPLDGCPTDTGTIA
jgi:hypothetical protein